MWYIIRYNWCRVWLVVVVDDCCVGLWCGGVCCISVYNMGRGNMGGDNMGRDNMGVGWVGGMVEN